MILADVYPGDDNRLLKDVQHEEYMANVWRIFASARSALVLADEMLCAERLITQQARSITVIDHRVMQDAHDILAAVFRYRYDNGGQLDLLHPDADSFSRCRYNWTVWLVAELDRLVGCSVFVRSSVQAVVFANTELGYAAERILCNFLLDNYRMASLVHSYAVVYSVPDWPIKC